MKLLIRDEVFVADTKRVAFGCRGGTRPKRCEWV